MQSPREVRSRTRRLSRVLAVPLLLGSACILLAPRAVNAGSPAASRARCVRSASVPSARRAAVRPVSLDHVGQTWPIDCLAPSTVASGASFQVTFYANQARGSMQIGCSAPTLVGSPSGSWPYVLNLPAGATSQTVTLTTAAVSSATTVTIYGGPTGVDISNPANQTASAATTLEP